MAAQKPRRQKKGDKLIHGSLPAHEVQVDYACGPFDRVAREMDAKWGIDRLPELVSPETAARYAKAVAGLNKAIDENNVDETIRWAASCIRGMQAMDAEAEAAGAKPASPECWEIEIDGMKVAVVKDDAAWPQIKKDRPELVIFTMREVAVALKEMQFGNVVAVKHAFPAATMIDAKKKPAPDYEKGGDKIDF